jgi:hypothetical protein
MPESTLSERARLEAGGLVRVGAEVGPDLATDTVDARGYTSPALPGRTVVRLVPDAIARGIDAEMELLGFSLASHADDLAVQRRRALGFPGATLVIDPERARYALDVMREFQRHAKRIASKPGHAKDGFDEVAARLSRQVPHFLPSYFEEVARAFAHRGNLTYAATFFDKARTAEREFGLEVDEERRAEAFLEFALLGALTVKSIQAYGKELQRLVGAPAAFDRLRTLAVRRTLGGVSPWAGLPKDLRSLAKAAKRDAGAEDASFLREVCSASSLRRAPASFWTDYRDAWVALAKADPAVRGRLLELFPTGGKARHGWRDDLAGFTDDWMTFLADSGALDALWSDVPEPARPNGSRAAWFARLQDWAGAGDGWTLQLVRRAATALRADGVRVAVSPGDWYRPLDVDLVDLLAELGVPWALREGGRRVDLAKWAGWPSAPARCGLPAEVRPRDPVFAAADPALTEILRPAVDQAFGNPTFEGVVGRMRGMKSMRERWLLDRVSDLSGPGLASTEAALDRLEKATSADHFAEFPVAAERLRTADLAAALGSTLRAGLVEEWVWPAWEEARALLGVDGPQGSHRQRVQWPYLLWYTPHKLVVLDQERIRLAVDLKNGDGKTLPDACWFVGGRALVGFHYWGKHGSVNVAYWSDAPGDTFELPGRWYATDEFFPFEHPDAIVIGTDRFTAGDRASPVPTPQFHDATTSWVAVDGRLRVQDRATGAPGPEGSPGFLRHQWHGVSYHPVPGDAAAHSPLVGVIDGQYGVKHLLPRDGDAGGSDDGSDPDEAVERVTLVTLAGDRFEGTMLLGSAELGARHLVRSPGRDAVRAVALESLWRPGGRVERVVLAGPGDRRAALTLDTGQRPAPPLATWHYLRPRDPAASAVLAGLGDAEARALIDTDPAGTAPGSLVPGVSDPALHAGVAAQVALARQCVERWRRLVDGRTAGGAERAAPSAPIPDEALAPAIRNLRQYWTHGGQSLSQAVETLGRFLREGETGETVTASRLLPHEWIGHVRGLAVNAARPDLSPALRSLLGTALRVFVGAGLAGPRVRAGTIEFSRTDLPWVVLVDDGTGGKAPPSSWRHHDGRHRLFLTNVAEVGTEPGKGPWSGLFVQHVTEGEPLDPPGATLRAVRTNAPGDAEWALALLDALAARGPFAVTRADAERLAAGAGLTFTDAALVLLGYPTEVEKDTREALGLKHAEGKAACLRMAGRPFAEKVATLAARGAAGVEGVWGPEAVDGVIAAHVAQHGRRVALDEALLLAADRELGGGGAAQVEQFVNHAGWKALHEEAPTDRRDREARGFDERLARAIARTTCWLAGRLPVGHPALAAVPEVLTAARARLASPAAWFDGGRWYHHEDKPRAAARAWFDALPSSITEQHRDADGEVVGLTRQVGPIRGTWTKHWTSVSFQPAGLDGAGRELLLTFSRMTGQECDALRMCDMLRGDGLTALAARIASPSLPAGRFDHDPLASAPDLVRTVAAAKGLSPEAAAAWLQLLALAEPSKKAVCEWNGWSPKVYDAAMAELTRAGLVVEGKRARAGRDHFLPGGWEDGKDGPPHEPWKRALYGADPKTGRLPLDLLVPPKPLPALFADAWARCARGDAPAFEEVRR